MSRLPNRNAPLPQAAQPRVTDSNVQRAFDLLFVPLREVVRFLQPWVQAEKWRALTFNTGWRNYSPIGAGVWASGLFRKDPTGRVFMQGLIERYSGASTLIATLPETHKPARQHLFCVYTNTGVGRIDVMPDGSVYLLAGGTLFISLDGISFDTVSE